MDSLRKASNQNILMGVICLCVPGMFNALNGLGAGGLEDSSISANALTAMYVSFSLSGAFVSGALNNALGHRITVFLSTLAFMFYVVSLWTYSETNSRGLVIAAGGLQGIGASLLWAAQGSLMMGYPLPREKGKFISLFWVVYNFGSAMGGMLSFGLNYDNVEKSISPYTFGIFVSLMIAGTLFSLLLVPTGRVIRSDGTPVPPPPTLTLKQHVTGLIGVYTDWRMILMAPLFSVSNYYYSYEFNTFNSLLFTTRTRSINNACFWAMQIVAAPVWGRLLDHPSLYRRQRGTLALAILVVTLVAIWGGTYAVQATYSNQNLPELIDFTHSGYFPLLLLYMCFGMADCLVQSTCFWVMGTFSNDPQVLARYTGFFGSVQSAASAVAWRLNAIGILYMHEYAIIVSFLGFACMCAIPVMLKLPEPEVSSEIDEKS